MAPFFAHRLQLLKLLSALLLLAFAQSILLLLIGPLLKAIFLSSVTLHLSDLVPPKLVGYIPSLSSYEIPMDWVQIGLPIAIVVAGVFKNIASYVYQLSTAFFSLKITETYRNKLFQAVIQQDYEEITGQSPGFWMSIIMNDAVILQNYFAAILQTLIRDVVLVLAALFSMLLIHTPSALFLLFMTPLVAFGMGRLGNRIHAYASGSQKQLSFIAGAILEIRKRFEFIRAQKGEKWEIQHFQKLHQRYYQQIRRSLWMRSSFAPGMELLGFAVFALFLYLSQAESTAQMFNGVNIVVFFAALGASLRPLKNIGEQYSKLHETRGSLKAGLNLLKKDHNRDCDEVHDLRQGIKPIRMKKLICQMMKKQVFAAENFTIYPGKTIAIVGPSGSGKSTFVKTLSGILRPKKWDGSVSWEQCAAWTTLVGQDPFLFTDTILANLTYGQKTKVSAEAITEVLEMVNMREDVEKLPEKLSTKLLALNSQISGGQLQRLAIARALLQSKPILLLDESTSGLDRENEKSIMEKIIRYMKEHQLVLIAVTHRLESLQSFDEVWFIEGGERILSGEHRDLLLTGERYAQFYHASI